LGHTAYYPRFGYQPHAYGAAQVAVPLATLPSEPLLTRGPAPEDVPQLRDLWRQEEGAVAMALDPGPDLLDWLSPHPQIVARVYLRAGEIAGYTRTHTATPGEPKMFLARDHAAAWALVATMAQEHALDRATAQVILPLHPQSASAGAFGTATVAGWAAAMVCPLAMGPVNDYLAQLKSGAEPPGRVIWPVAFDLNA
jgi:hypothetical protein